ncbi:Ig-like domain-containing protein [Streptomyces sp. NBC_00503]|uniref:Ig-like domain-containing protein n=1 Tax=Streptomyces sp. NBC_00503 TaxID=2903659 RepID=UPI002E80F78A|nr:Ig-like domain-containing protein [Streptomyces sp. NBC_00503]WUD85145.1 Ig-like domain-containing protein [Streptomyces sp. NBC_00503]
MTNSESTKKMTRNMTRLRPGRSPYAVSRTAVALGAAGLLAALLVPLAAAADPADAAGPCGPGGAFTSSPPTCTYATAGTDVFTVPAGVSALTVDLYGAEGGSAAGFVAPSPPNDGSPGGLGGRTHAVLAVTPGQSIQITRGGVGSSGTSRHGEYARVGGFGHGSGGGGAHGGGGSGGGATDLRTGAFGSTDRILVAGGGGGAGNGGPLLHGGNGGGPAGDNGGDGGGPEGSGIGGTGGSRTQAGIGVRTNPVGAKGGDASDIDQNTGLPNPGSGGTGGNGGRGGNGGGGGGGGWHGGGGGSGGGNPGEFYAAGGGGGSGYAAAAEAGVSEAGLFSGVQHGNGKAVVSFRFATSTSLVADTSTPLFGHSVALTATVDSANPLAATPGGSVTFSDGTTPLATVPLEAGKAVFTTSALRPGLHPISASYTPDADHTASTTGQPAGITVGFSRPCITTASHGPLTVASGQSLCIGSGGSQSGPVTVRPGGALAVSDGQITGPVSADGALAVSVCGSKVTGPLSVRTTSGSVLIGAGPGSQFSDCAGNTITGPVSLVGNTGGVEFSADRVTGPLGCEANAPAPHVGDVTVLGPRSGQCL